MTEVLEDNTLSTAHTAAAVAQKKQTKNKSRVASEYTTSVTGTTQSIPGNSSGLSSQGAGSALDETRLSGGPNHNIANTAESPPTSCAENTDTSTTTTPASKEQEESGTFPSADARPARPQSYLYLQKPRTIGNSTVLIPLTNHEDTITTCLRSSTLNEFPTIYDLPYAPTELPERYTLASVYDKDVAATKHDIDNELNKQGLNDVYERVAPGKEQMNAEGEDAWDERKILDMLKRDVSALR